MSQTQTAAPSAAPDDAPSGPVNGHRHLGWALVLICVAQLMVVLDSTIANIALPFIGKDLDIGQANLQWIVTGYSLAFGGLLLLGGRLGDLYGRRRIFMIGLTLFAVASALGGIAQSEVMLLGARGLQGLGAALASPTALALITTNFPAGPQRNRAFSVYAAISGVGAAIGLILGGWLTGIEPAGIDGWRLTFLINVPIGIVAALLAPRILGESETHSGELDVPGAVSATAGLMAIVFGLSRAGQSAYGWGAPSTIIALVLGVALLVGFVLIENRIEHPLLPFRILLNRTRATAFVAMMIVPAAMFAMFFFLSLTVQDVMGYSPLHTGVAFLPFCVGMVFSATVASKLMERVDPRFIAGVGTVLAGIALWGFSRLSVDDSPANLLKLVGAGGGHLGDSVGYWGSIFPYVMLMSIGMGAVFVPMTLAAVHGVSHRDSGIGSGVLNTMQQVGGALGLATLATVATHFTSTKAAELSTAVSKALPMGSPAPSGHTKAIFESVVGQAAFTHGATHAFLVGAFMMWAASAIVWIFLSVKHEELATDEAPEGVAVG